VSRDQLAPSSVRRVPLGATDSDAVAQLFHFAAHRFFGQRGLVDVRPSGDVAVPLCPDSFRSDFRSHRGKACGKVPPSVKNHWLYAAFTRSPKLLFYASCTLPAYHPHHPMTTPPDVDVLIVEDDSALSQMLVHAVQRGGLTTDVAGDTVEAKRLLSRGNYRVLVLDLILPDGTGFDILAFIRSERLAPPQVLVITAADASLLVKLDRSLVKTVTFKPFDVEQFVSTVQLLANDQTNRFRRPGGA
jgi:CheY-like chemotaxis protein